MKTVFVFAIVAISCAFAQYYSGSNTGAQTPSYGANNNAYGNTNQGYTQQQGYAQQPNQQYYQSSTPGQQQQFFDPAFNSVSATSGIVSMIVVAAAYAML